MNGNSVSDGTIVGTRSSFADDDFADAGASALGNFGGTSDSSGFVKGDFASAPNLAAVGGTGASAAGSANLDTSAYGQCSSATVDTDFSATGNGAFAADQTGVVLVSGDSVFDGMIVGERIAEVTGGFSETDSSGSGNFGGTSVSSSSVQVPASGTYGEVATLEQQETALLRSRQIRRASEALMLLPKSTLL